MSWQRIVLPFTTETNPDIVELGKRAWEVYRTEQQPEGFAMFQLRWRRASITRLNAAEDWRRLGKKR